jgi:hypothetical protein
MDENPYKPPEADSATLSGQGSRLFARHTVIFCIGFYAVAILVGITGARPSDSALGFLGSLVIAISLGGWAVTDARRRGRPIVSGAKFFFFIFAVFVVPCYVIWTRGWRGLGWVILNGVAWFMLAMATVVVCWSVGIGEMPNN